MKRFRFEIGLGLFFIAIWAGFYLWQNPGFAGQRLHAEDAARYVAVVEKLPFPEQDRPQLIERLRAWIASDDGKPVYMMNLMRFYPELHKLAGSASNFQGTPRESNARYEDAAMPMLFKLGGYPLYAGNAPGKNLLEFDPTLDDWNRLLIIRYPSRRAFLELLNDPAYAGIEPLKLMALSVVLTPTAAEMVIPELPWVVAGLLVCAFLAIGWRRAAARNAKEA